MPIVGCGFILFPFSAMKLLIRLHIMKAKAHRAAALLFREGVFLTNRGADANPLAVGLVLKFVLATAGGFQSLAHFVSFQFYG